MNFRKLLNILICGLALLAGTAFAERELPLPRVYTVYDDSTEPCFRCKSCPLIGIYVDANIGNSWISLSPYRGNSLELLALGVDDVKESSDSFSIAVGYDLYPCSKIPLRTELNYFYTDQEFKINPLFANNEEGFFSKDSLIVKNLMATLYMDWHTCTRIVPYVGVSGGVVNVKTYHHPNDAQGNLPFTFKATQRNLAFGATAGTHYFFNSNIFGNIQVRYSNFGTVFFNDESEAVSPIPQLSDFKSDYLHETTLLVGLGCLF